MHTLAVRNSAQWALFEGELKGQISDGMWENTPNTDWHIWCDAWVIVDPSNLGRDFHVRKDSFMFNAKSLLDVVEDRMLAYARLGTAFGVNMTDSEMDAVITLSNFTPAELAMPGYREWIDNMLKKVEAFKARTGYMGNVIDVVKDPSYNHDDLIHDLRDLRKIIKMRRS